MSLEAQLREKLRECQTSSAAAQQPSPSRKLVLSGIALCSTGARTRGIRLFGSPRRTPGYDSMRYRLGLNFRSGFRTRKHCVIGR
jgi:hypothetical protein